MASETNVDPDERDWRLTGELALGEEKLGALRSLVDRVHEPRALHDAEQAAGDDVVVTHDGNRLFAYAADRATIERARTSIEAALQQDGVEAHMQLTSWSQEREEWLDPDAPAPRVGEAQESERTVTRTFVATLGRWVREEFEQSLLQNAARLGLTCTIVEHPHLLNTQAAFTVTGPARKVGEFERAMKAEERATIRTESAVMASPL